MVGLQISRSLGLVLAVSVLLRVAASLMLGNEVLPLPGTADQVSYHTLAQRVLEGHGFSFEKAWWPATAAEAPTAHWSYLYTLYLTAVYGIFGLNPLVARVIQAVIVGILHPLLVYRIATRVFPSSRDAARRASEAPVPSTVGLVAAAVTSIYAYFVYYSATLMTEPFYITAVLACLALAIEGPGRITRGKQIGFGIALGAALSVAVLLRQLFLLFIPLLLIWIVWAALATRTARRAILGCGIAVLMLIVSIAPFSIYNYLRFDRFVLLNTNAGYAFYLANHPIYGAEFKEASEMNGTYQQLIPDEWRHLNEAQLDSLLLVRGIQIVIDDPGRYLLLSASRIPIYFNFWIDPDSGTVSNIARISSFGLLLPFIVLGLFKSLRASGGLRARLSLARLGSAEMLLYAFVVVYAAVHLLSWVQIRYRLPIDAVLVVFAALGLMQALAIVRQGRSRADLHARTAGTQPTG